ncbi:hypothetical protein HY625_03305 [Candidatus Uhrbacteria bacterium]|nr:hypothetical protein [Candidatus Uhrbacteria bacterium]
MHLRYRYFVFIALVIGISVVVFLLRNRIAPQKQERMSNPLLWYSAYQYLSEKKSDRPSLQIFSYDPSTQGKHTIAAYPPPTMPDPYTQSMLRLFRRSPRDATVYYFFKTQQQGNVRTMVKIVRGSVERTVQFSSQPGTDVGIAEDEATMAWCDNGALHIREFATNAETIIPNTIACSLGSVDFTFSRDGKKLYYRRGFYELLGEYTNEQVTQWARENRNGLHVIDLASRDDTIVTTEEQGMLLWDDPLIDEQQGRVLVLSPTRDRITVKALANRQFDYLLASDIQKLSTIQEVKMPNRIFPDVFQTVDGKGIFFLTSPEYNQNFSEDALGYVDIQSGATTFPIAITTPAKKHVTLFAAIDAGHLYILFTGLNAIEDRAVDLYAVNVNGKQQLVDTITDGQFDFLGAAL